MANYNNSSYLEDSIESVLSQCSRDWELLICDDASTDNSIEIIESFMFRSKSIRLMINPFNLGYIATLKRLIVEARYQIVGILDSDDALTIDAVEKIIDEYNADPDLGFVYSDFVRCDKYLDPIAFRNKKYVQKYDALRTFISHFKTFKVSAYNLTLGFDEAFVFAEDRDIIYKLEEVAKCKYIDHILYKHRNLVSSQSKEGFKRIIGLESHIDSIICTYARRKRKGFSPNFTLDELQKRISFLRKTKDQIIFIRSFGIHDYQARLLLDRLRLSNICIKLLDYCSVIASKLKNMIPKQSQQLNVHVCHAKKLLFVGAKNYSSACMEKIVLARNFSLLNNIYCFNMSMKLPLNNRNIFCKKNKKIQNYVKLVIFWDPIERFKSFYIDNILSGKRIAHADLPISIDRAIDYIQAELKKPLAMQNDRISLQHTKIDIFQPDYIVSDKTIEKFMQLNFDMVLIGQLFKSTQGSVSLSDAQTSRLEYLYRFDYCIECDF